jgi:hypothetical protein
MVLSDEEKVRRQADQVCVKELNESKPFDEVSKDNLLTKLLGFEF